MDVLAFEIFSHLPAKSVLKLSIISKQCHENLSSQLLANKQFKNLQDKEDSCFFIQSKHCEKSSPIPLQLKFLCETFRSFCGFPPVSHEFLSMTGSILASHNGLLCCKNIYDAEYPVFLCNPVTRTWLPIIKPTINFNNNHPFNFILVDHNQEGDYMLMHVGSRSEDVWETGTRLCSIYSPQNKVWQERDEMMVGLRSIDFGSPAYLKNENGGGTIYFMSDWNKYLTKDSPFYWPYIMSYNFGNSISRFLKIPRPARKGVLDDNCKFGVFKFRDPESGTESICLIRLMKLVFSVWVLTDVDLNTWRMIMKARSKAMGLYEDSRPTISGFTVMNGNLLVIATSDNQLFTYTLTRDLTTSSNVKRAAKIGSHDQCGREDVCFYSYSNTLRPCGHGELPLPLQ